jgi:hypothetical protein
VQATLAALCGQLGNIFRKNYKKLGKIGAIWGGFGGFGCPSSGSVQIGLPLDHFWQFWAVDREHMFSVQFFSTLVAFRP